MLFSELVKTDYPYAHEKGIYYDTARTGLEVWNSLAHALDVTIIEDYYADEFSNMLQDPIEEASEAMVEAMTQTLRSNPRMKNVDFDYKAFAEIMDKVTCQAIYSTCIDIHKDGTISGADPDTDETNPNPGLVFLPAYTEAVRFGFQVALAYALEVQDDVSVEIGFINHIPTEFYPTGMSV